MMKVPIYSKGVGATLILLAATGLGEAGFGAWVLLQGNLVGGVTNLGVAAITTVWFMLRTGWYQMGYRAGRRVMIESAFEARERCVSFDAWLAMEWERDAVDLGLIKPKYPTQQEGNRR